MSQPSEAGPVPIAAEIFGNILVVTFDRELLNTSLDPDNWGMRFSNQAYYADDATIDIAQVNAEMVPSGADPGPNVCSYAGVPVDVLALDGTPAAPFSDFPIN